MAIKNLNKKFFTKMTPIASSVLIYCAAFQGQALAEEAVQTESKSSIEVIQVTSTKRVTSLMETGQAVSAFTEEGMKEKGIENAQDLVQYTPSLVMTSSKIAIRGIGRPTISLGSDPGVGVYSDGVYSSENGIFSNCNFCDIERIEVLRGPQGTLYGRNAVGGAINLISKEPDTDFGGYSSLDYGSDGYSMMQGQVTGALTETFSAIATVSKMYKDGIQENIGKSELLDSRDSLYYSTTLKADWSDTWTSSLRYARMERDGLPSNGYGVDPYPTDFVNGFFGVTNIPGFFPGSNGLNWFAGYQGENPAINDISQVNVDSSPSKNSVSERLSFINIAEFNDLELKYTFGYSKFDYLKQTDADQSNASLGAVNYSEIFRQLTLYGFGADGTGHYLPNPLTGQPLTMASELQFNFEQSSESMSHELILTSNFDGNLNFIAGLYYYNNEESQYSDYAEYGFGFMHGDPIAAAYKPLGVELDSGTYLGYPGLELGLYQWIALASGGLPFAETGDGGGFLYYGQNDLETTSTAVFGQVEYDASDELTLTAGLRYSNDEKKGSDNIFAYLSVPDFTHELEDDWSKVTWRLQADWQMDDDTLLYAYVATGYRSGGFNLGAASMDDISVVDPEELLSYEIGYKKRMLDGRMNLTATGYYYDYNDLQVFSSEVNNGVTTTHYSNAAEATVLGAEFELQALLTDDLVVDVSYSYANSEYGEYEARDSVACAIFGPGNGDCAIQDLSGNQLNLAPEHKASLSAIQYFYLDDLGEVSLMAGYSYIGDQYGRSFNREDWDKIEAYDTIDARITWTSSEDTFAISLWAKNISDDRHMITAGAPSTTTRLRTGEVTDPRSYGIKVQYNF